MGTTCGSEQAPVPDADGGLRARAGLGRTLASPMGHSPNCTNQGVSHLPPLARGADAESLRCSCGLDCPRRLRVTLGWSRARHRRTAGRVEPVIRLEDVPKARPVGSVLGLLLQGPYDHRLDLVVGNGPRRTRARVVTEAVQAMVDEAAAPLAWIRKISPELRDQDTSRGRRSGPRSGTTTSPSRCLSGGAQDTPRSPAPS